MSRVYSNKLLKIAKSEINSNKFEYAKQLLISAINTNNCTAEHYELLATIYERTGEKSQCLKYLILACKLQDASAEAHFYLGTEYIKINKIIDGINHINLSIKIAGDFIEGLIEIGLAYLKLSKPVIALDFFLRALHINQNNTDVMFNIGKLYCDELTDYKNGLKFYNKILKLEPKNHNALIAKGILFNETKKYDKSTLCYLKAININPNLSIAWHNIGKNLVEKKQPKLALQYFEKANLIVPYNPIYLSNIASCHFALKSFIEAEFFFKEALKYKNDFDKALIGLSLCEFNNNNLTQAFELIEQAIKYHPNNPDCWFWKGNYFASIKKFTNAIKSYEMALDFNHEHLPLLGSLLDAKLKICDWNGVCSLFATVAKKVSQNQLVISPLTFQSINADPCLNLQCSKIWSNYQLHILESKFSIKPKKSKIRIGYFSPDFKSHPVLYLTEKIYELHDRSKFEIYGFYLSDEIDDNTKIIASKFDKFFYVKNFSDGDLINFVRNHEIDIAIDLAGHTLHSRTNIFLNRIAQTQINFIGYPGTLGAKEYDFIIGDYELMPQYSQSFYSEKILYLKRTFQPNGIRFNSNRFNTRKELGLPEGSFIYCCFNSNFKITESIFNSWMNILKRTQNSLLWLVINYDEAKINIYNKLTDNGLPKSRVIFAEPLPYSDHLNRLKFANLFLDTYPFNAGTTCSDSLWSRVPLITLRGESYCSRMSHSILSFNSLDELVVNTMDEYENVAVQLCEDKVYYENIKAKLTNYTHASNFFNPHEYTADFENALITAHTSNI